MRVQPSARSARSLYAWTLAVLLVGGAGCANSPSATDPTAADGADSHGPGRRSDFSGAWTTQLPQGRLVLFYAHQSGSLISGAISNFGPPIAGLTFPITGTVDGASVTLDFMYPAGLSEGPTVDLPVAWHFRGAFTSATTVEGAITSSTGITGNIVITEDTGAIPLATTN
jgi:hypothetical protein